MWLRRTYSFLLSGSPTDVSLPAQNEPDSNGSTFPLKSNTMWLLVNHSTSLSTFPISDTTPDGPVAFPVLGGGGLQCLHNFSLQDDVTRPPECPLPSHIPPSQTSSTFTNIYPCTSFTLPSFPPSFLSVHHYDSSSPFTQLVVLTSCLSFTFMHCNPESVTSAPQLVCNLIISIINTKYNITVT